mmetsp:Transcript_44962/g.73286  ORF Transcript_44962/g.73286 Transcript_44962/m.73286 type:complete len:158 (+) Transcript_44962:173-646(+)
MHLYLGLCLALQSWIPPTAVPAHAHAVAKGEWLQPCFLSPTFWAGEGHFRAAMPSDIFRRGMKVRPLWLLAPGDRVEPAGNCHYVVPTKGHRMSDTAIVTATSCSGQEMCFRASDWVYFCVLHGDTTEQGVGVHKKRPALSGNTMCLVNVFLDGLTK